ncbi:hypothetical protein EMIT0196MI5_50066 [Pseudomonas sp. IT-196MI5]
MFISDCSFVFSNERRLTVFFNNFKLNQQLVISGMFVALELRLLDSNNKKAEPCHSPWSTSAAPSRARSGSTMPT